MKYHKESFAYGLVVGMVLVGIIIIFSFFLGNPAYENIFFRSSSNPSSNVSRTWGGLFSSTPIQLPYRIKRFNRDGKDFVYVIEGGNKSSSNYNKTHPNKTPLQVAPGK